MSESISKDKILASEEPLRLTELDPSHLLTQEEAAEFLNVTPQTLAVWRCTGRYPLRFVKVGRKVRYRAGDALAFLESRSMTQTAA